LAARAVPRRRLFARPRRPGRGPVSVSPAVPPPPACVSACAGGALVLARHGLGRWGGGPTCPAAPGTGARPPRPGAARVESRCGRGGARRHRYKPARLPYGERASRSGARSGRSKWRESDRSGAGLRPPRLRSAVLRRVRPGVRRVRRSLRRGVASPAPSLGGLAAGPARGAGRGAPGLRM
jgi:hypothetical protein